MKKFPWILTLVVCLFALPTSAKPADLAAIALGLFEVPPVDTDSLGVATFDVLLPTPEGPADRARVEFVLFLFRGREITQAHIHCGEFGTNGPIVVFLTGLVENGHDVNGLWVANASFQENDILPGSECGDTMEEVLRSMREGNTYMNVHSVANPGGEVRGQIVPR